MMLPLTFLLTHPEDEAFLRYGRERYVFIRFRSNLLMSRELEIQPGGNQQDFDIDYKSDLNEQQLGPVTHGTGSMLVLAGAGSGKTRTLTYRVAYLIEQGVPSDQILLATFTNKAAREMLNRVNRLTGGRAENVWGGTFHHTANAILRRHADLLDYSRQYTILDSEDTETLLEDCITELGLDEMDPPLPNTGIIKQIYSLHKNMLEPVEDVVDDRFPYHTEHLPSFEQIFELFDRRKKDQDLMDFDDLLTGFHQLLKTEEDIRSRYAQKFRHVLVDEFQDTNAIQSEIVDLLSEEHGNLMVVGDDAQSIYSFRGADYKNILQFEERHPDATIYKLEINYRSTPEVLALANSSIQNNQFQFPKNLEAVRDSGYKPSLVVPETETEQSEFLATHVRRLHEEEGIPYSNQAILYRAHHQSLSLQVELTQRGIPYYVRSGLRFFEQRHIKDIVSYIKAVLNVGDELAWKRVMKLYRGIGPKTAAKIYSHLEKLSNPVEGMGAEVVQEKLTARNRESWKTLKETMENLKDLAAENRGAAAMIDVILDDFYRQYALNQFENAHSRLEDIDQLAVFADRQPDLDTFLSEMALRTNLGAEEVDPEKDEEEDNLVLSTVHQAKGLEWDVVFMIWLTEGEFPHSRSTDDQEDLEEERRLFYVGCTRARDELYLVYPLFSQRRQGDSFQNPSRFIQELDDSTYEEASLTRTSI